MEKKEERAITTQVFFAREDIQITKEVSAFADFKLDKYFINKHTRELMNDKHSGSAEIHGVRVGLLMCLLDCKSRFTQEIAAM